MNDAQSRRNRFFYVAGLLPLLTLSGCAPLDWVKDKMGGDAPAADKKESKKNNGANSYATAVRKTQDASEVLVTMAGEPIVTVDTLEKDFEQLLAENPQLKSVLPLMPGVKYNFLQGKVSQHVVDRYIKESGIDQQPEYQEERDRMINSVVQMLNTKYFGDRHPVKLSNVELRQYYEENKDGMPDLLVSRGGIDATGVSFANAKAAQDFLAKAKGDARNFEKVAREQGVAANLKDFKMVNDQSVGMNVALRDKIVALEKVPSVELLKIDNDTYWVVNATKKEAKKYRPFDQIKDNLEQYVIRERKMEALDKEINKLKSEYGVVVNEEYFKKQQVEAQNRLAENNQAHNDKAQPAALKTASADKKNEKAAESKKAKLPPTQVA